MLDSHRCTARLHVDDSRSGKEELSHVVFFLHLHDNPILYIRKNPYNKRLVDTYILKGGAMVDQYTIMALGRGEYPNCQPH